MKAMKKRILFAVLLVLTLVGMSSCCRRELWVYQDGYKNIVLRVDWRFYDRDAQLFPHEPDPDGMTLYVFPQDGRPSYRFTTTEVNRYEFYMSRGMYDFLVFDYSPEEYNMQHFTGMGSNAHKTLINDSQQFPHSKPHCCARQNRYAIGH